MKKILVVILATIMILMCSACSPSTGTIEQQFVIINTWSDDTGKYKVLVDLDTSVEYLWYKDISQYGQCMTVMVDQDGNPIVYDGKLEFGGRE